MSTDLLGPAELRPMVEAVIAAHPDRLNPINGSLGCLYTAADDPDNHCVVGQVAADAGWDVPDCEEQEAAGYIAERYDWPVSDEGVTWLAQVQLRADLATWEGRPWSTIEIPEVPA